MSEISEVEIKAMSKEQNYLKGYLNGKSDTLKELKQLKEQAQWIPVSERYPEKEGIYLVTMKNIEKNTIEIYKGEYTVFVCDFIFFGKHRKPVFESIYTGIEIGAEYKDREVIAWMPLPERYKGEEEATNEKNCWQQV